MPSIRCRVSAPACSECPSPGAYKLAHPLVLPCVQARCRHSPARCLIQSHYAAAGACSLTPSACSAAAAVSAAPGLVAACAAPQPKSRALLAGLAASDAAAAQPSEVLSRAPHIAAPGDEPFGALAAALPRCVAVGDSFAQPHSRCRGAAGTHTAEPAVILAPPPPDARHSLFLAPGAWPAAGRRTSAATRWRSHRRGGCCSGL